MAIDYRITVENDETGDCEECEWFSTEEDARTRFAELTTALNNNPESELCHAELCIVLDAEECGYAQDEPTDEEEA